MSSPQGIIIMMSFPRRTFFGLFTLLVACLPSAARANALGPPKATISAELSTVSLQPGQQAVIAVTMTVPDGYHAQVNQPTDKDAVPTIASLKVDPAFTAYAAQFPKGEEHIYTFGKAMVYTGKTVMYLPFQVASEATLSDVTIKGVVTYQACEDASGTCFQPTDLPFAITTKVVSSSEPSVQNKPELFKNFDPRAFTQLPPTTKPAGAAKGSAGGLTIFGRDLSNVGTPLAFLAALVIGVIMNCMPCVLPVLPLKAIGFYETSQHNRAKSLAYGFVFSLGIISTFAGLALLVLLGGHSWGDMFAKSWFVWTLVVILVLFALSQFGLYTFSLPVGVYTFDPKKDSYTGNFLFGILTAILSTPCTAPIFPGLLAWAISQQKWVGIGVIMTVGVGMALPYILLSALPELARKIPRTGPWSELVKQMMGFLLLAVAGYFAGQRLLHGTDYIWVVFTIVVIGGIFLVARTAQLMPRLRPIMTACILAIVFCGGTFVLAKSLSHQGLTWAPFSQQALDKAQQEKRIVLIDFTANWCANCQYVEATVFTDEKALDSLKKNDVLLIQADLTTSDAAGWELLRKLNPSGGIPLTAIYAPGRSEPILLASIYRPPNLVAALDEASHAKLAAAK